MRFPHTSIRVGVGVRLCLTGALTGEFGFSIPTTGKRNKRIEHDAIAAGT